MTPDNPFLQALLAEPDDDTLRLALADWLDENGQPARAEFVRVQIELARGGSSYYRRCRLELRQRDLLVAHDAEWVAPIARVLHCRPGEWGGWVFRRGFAEYFRLPAHTLVSCGAQLSRLTPVRELNLVYDPMGGGSQDYLWREPWLRSVTHLYGVGLDDEGAAALLDSPHLTGLRVLDCHWDQLDTHLQRRLVKQFGHALPSGRGVPT